MFDTGYTDGSHNAFNGKGTEYNMTSSSEPLASVFSEELDLPPSCVEFCPAHPSYFLVGTYNLQKPDEEAGELDHSQDDVDAAETTRQTRGKKPQSRNGTVIVFELAGGDTAWV